LKYLLLIALLAGGYHFYTENQGTSEEITTSGQIFKKVETSGASLEEIQQGVYLFTASLCNDSYFQETGGSSTSICLSRLENRTNRCNASVFRNAPDMFHDKKEVEQMIRKFSSCIGAV